MDNRTSVLTGLWYLCLCNTGPLLIGIALGWLLRGRRDRVGFPWAFLPGFVKRVYDYIQSIELEEENE